MAPIPAIHIVDGEEIFAEHGRVAYGSNAIEIFHRLRQDGQDRGLPVLIYASATDSENVAGKIALQKIVSIAWLDGFDFCGRDGKHIRPHLRPKRAQANDSPFTLFWEVIKLKRLEHPENLNSVRTLQATGKRGRSPASMSHGPIRVWVDSETLSNNF